MNLALMLNQWWISQLAGENRQDCKRHKAILKKHGLSYRRAAIRFGVHFTHLDRVLQGRRESQALLDQIEALENGGAA